MFYIYADGNSIYDPTVSAYYLFEPTLTLEFGKAGSLEFSIPKDNVYYNSLKQMKTIVVVKLDDTEIFRGRVLSFETGFDNFKKVYCEGDLAYLVDSVQPNFNFEGGTHELFRQIITTHNSRVENYKHFQVGNINIEDRHVKIKGITVEGEEQEEDNNYEQIFLNTTSSEYSNSYDFIQNSIIDYCGGYLVTRRVGNTTYIDLLKDYVRTSGQQVSFGVNLLDLTQEASADELFTVLVPIGDKNLTIASVNNGSDELVNEQGVASYGRIVRSHVFSNVTEASTLLEDAKKYLADNAHIPLTVTARAIDMHLLNDNVDSIRIGDRVKINSNVHGLSEYLTCTKIEYDFASPENNSYTFGNPKQTLTQRYREDKREQNSGGGGYGSGIGSAIAKNEDDVDKKIEDAKDWIYKEWLDIDEDNPDGKGGLYGAYRRINKMQEVLETQVGINFDATTGNANLQSITKKLNKQGQQIGEAESKINTFSGEVNGKLTAVSSMIAKVQTDTGERIASLEVIADENSTKIKGIADELDIEAIKTHIGGVSERVDELKRKLKTQVGLDMDAETGQINLQSLTQRVNDQGRVIQETKSGLETLTTAEQATSRLFAEYKTTNGKKIAQIEATADALGSNLNLKADKITVDAKFTKFNGDIEAINARFDTITANKITTTELEAALGNIQQLKVNSLLASGSIYASSMYIGPNPSPTNTVATQGNVNATLAKIGNAGAHGNAHAHLITENSDGTITLGYATKDPQTFNIRATKTYREGVAAATKAVKITELDKDPIYVDSYSSNNREYTVHIWSKTDSGAVKRTPITVSGSRAWQDGYTSGAAAGSQDSYQDGVDSVRVQSVIARNVESWGTDHYNRQTHTTSVFGTAKLSSGQNDYIFQLTTGTDAYEDGVSDGVDSVTIDSVTRTPGVPDSYNPLLKKTIINYTATASNGKTLLGSFTTDTKAYDDGYKKGTADGKDNITILSLGKDPDKSYTHDFTKHTVTVPIKTVISNGKSQTESLSVSTTTHYTAGVESVTVKSVTKNGTETYNPKTFNTTIPIIVKLSSGKNNFTTNITTGADAYNAGKTAGIDSVTIKSVTRIQNVPDSFNPISHKVTINYTATASNGKTLLGTFTTDTKAYEEGKKAGANDTTISSVDWDSATEKTLTTVNDYAKHIRYYPVIATASNGKTGKNTFAINVSGHYKTGYEKGKADAGGIKSIARHSDWPNDNYNQITHKTTVYVVATANDGTTKIGTFTTDTTAYDKGYTKGTSDAKTGIKSVTRTPNVPDSFNPVNHKVTINYTATANDDTKYIGSFTTDDTAYEKGYTKGSDDGYTTAGNDFKWGIYDHSPRWYNEYYGGYYITVTYNDGSTENWAV